jgi:hypothetical protein
LNLVAKTGTPQLKCSSGSNACHRSLASVGTVNKNMPLRQWFKGFTNLGFTLRTDMLVQNWEICPGRAAGRAYLCSKHSDEIFDVRPDERVLQHGCLARPQNSLKLVDVTALIGFDQVGHCLDLRVRPVRLGLLCIKRVHMALHQHACQHQVLQTLNSAICTGSRSSTKAVSEQRPQHNKLWEKSCQANEKHVLLSSSLQFTSTSSKVHDRTRSIAHEVARARTAI